MDISLLIKCRSDSVNLSSHLTVYVDERHHDVNKYQLTQDVNTTIEEYMHEKSGFVQMFMVAYLDRAAK